MINSKTCSLLLQIRQPGHSACWIIFPFFSRKVVEPARLALDSRTFPHKSILHILQTLNALVILKKRSWTIYKLLCCFQISQETLPRQHGTPRNSPSFPGFFFPAGALFSLPTSKPLSFILWKQSFLEPHLVIRCCILFCFSCPRSNTGNGRQSLHRAMNPLALRIWLIISWLTSSVICHRVPYTFPVVCYTTH